MENYTLLCPQMSPVHFSLVDATFAWRGHNVVVLQSVDRYAIEDGLRYVNNDACYPAIVVCGQLIQALKSGKYDLERTGVLISQTCGGCRSTNYRALLELALRRAGFANVKVLPLNVNVVKSGDVNYSERFNVDLMFVRKMLVTILYGDLLLLLANRCRPYELVSGATDKLTSVWVSKLREIFLQNKRHSISKCMSDIVADFEKLELDESIQKPKVGIVGEILVKYHPDANRNLVTTIESEGGEAIVPGILDFMLYCLSSDQHKKPYADVSFFSGLKSRFAVWVIEKYRDKMRYAMRKSKRFESPKRFHHLVEKASKVISTCNQAGEGWLLTGEMVELIEDGCPNIVCVQPFGCLPNHITGKGVFKELRSKYPIANITTIDYDAGTTEVNQLNRIKLMMSVAQKNLHEK
ncbi:MAG: 2-hydroxyacyl-CoA dehydratase [Planctomycetaceae bacterium]|jgi:predicted nucleotide-binding protein (sugar kinase/HSP70/actin superfamily)|nr:2-hydroxyacyl-CoA dehydratase [Planctomycetaceae bacterium]